MREAERQRLRELVEWRPAHGVISAYFNIDRGDRAGGWHLGLRDGLAALQEPEDHDGRIALRQSRQRIVERFDPESEPPTRTTTR